MTTGMRLRYLVSLAPAVLTRNNRHIVNVNIIKNTSVINLNSNNYVRNFQTAPTTRGIFGPPQDENIFKRFAKKLGWTDTSRSILKASGYLMYIKIADEVNYMSFFNQCRLEDTFLSWFTVMELHIWLLSARLMQEGDEGRIIRNSLLKAMWEDCDTKSKKLEGALASARRKQIQTLGDQFQATIVSYDEGLLGDDTVLAGALWRRFLHYRVGSSLPLTQNDLHNDAVALEMLVLYVRSQFYNLNGISKQLLLKRKFSFAPFDSTLFQPVEEIIIRQSISKRL